MTRESKNSTIIFFLKEYYFANQYFGDLIKRLKVENNIIIVHTSKLENSKINDNLIENYDISFYNNKEIKNLFNHINPTSILITNIRSLLDIYIILLCNDTNRKIIYIEHGLTLAKLRVFKKSNIFHSIKKYLVYSTKVIFFIFSSTNKKKYSHYIIQALFKSNYKNFIINAALLYSESSKEILNKFLDLSKTNLLYSGYPISNTTEVLENLKKNRIKKQVVFIHQPLIIDKFQLLSIEKEIEIFNTLNDIIKLQGYQFILKLHPRTNPEIYKNRFKGLIISKEETAEKLISDSEITIGYFSTALITTLILNRKMIIFKHKSIITPEINTFITKNNSFESTTEFELLFKSILNENLELNQIDVLKIAGVKNTHEYRFQNLIKLIHS